MWPTLNQSFSTVMCFNHHTQEGSSHQTLVNDTFGHYHDRSETLFLPPGATCEAVPGPYHGNIPGSDDQEAASWNQSPISHHSLHTTEMIELQPVTTTKVQTPADIYKEIVGECEHLEREQECVKCQYRTDAGGTEAIALKDLVDIVLEAAESIVPRPPSRTFHYKSGESPEEILNKKRMQNKRAAARYRDKQKQKSEHFRLEVSTLEDTNRELKAIVASLEKDIEKARKNIFNNIQP